MFNYKHLPKDLLPVIKQKFQPYVSLLPKWCNEVVIIYNPEGDGDTLLTCVPDFKYRNAVIQIHPNFFYIEPRHAIIHEIIHIYVAEYSNRVEDILNEILPEQVRELILKDISSREEGFVEDLSNKFYELFKTNSKK